MTSRPSRLLGAAATAVLVCALQQSAHARTGNSDPVEVFREREVDDEDNWDLVLHGHLRARGAGYHGLDMGLVSPTTKAPPFAPGTGASGDVRARLTPSLFVGEDLRLFADVDAVALGLGALPTGVAVSSSTGLQTSFLDVRALGVDWMLPIGVLSIGRAPSRFGMGVGTTDGAGIDDDGGDRADRVSFIMPFFGHLLAAALDLGPGPGGAGFSGSNTFGPTTRSLQVGEQAFSVGVMRWHAPWEVALYERAARPLFNYGAALSVEWMSEDMPGLSSVWAPPAVRTDARLVVLDAWVRFVWGAFSVEGEAWAGDMWVKNPSPWAGVVIREPLTGNPFAGALVLRYEAMPDLLALSLEAGAASSDPAPGFLVDQRTAFARAVPGDVRGPQIDYGAGDTRVDAGRIHPLHRIDLILWRTVLGGVSEAGYLRAATEVTPHELVAVDAALITSFAWNGPQTPGGRAPLGVELDVGAEARLPFHEALSARLDLGVLAPLGGMQLRGTAGGSVAFIGIGRIAYAL